MSRPQRYLIRMALFLAVVVAIAAGLWPALGHAFQANLALNGIIIAVLLIGVLFIFRQVWMLYPEVAWVQNFRQPDRSVTSGAVPRLLAPLASGFGERSGKRLSLSPLVMRTFLDSVAVRLDESRETSRYLIGLLVFLGLLGTFYGLLETVRSVGDVIKGLSGGGGDVGQTLANLQASLQKPLSGMSTAFSSSLFGLAGSLVLGFLDLQAGQAQGRFFNELEEWLVSLTRMSSSSSVEAGEQPVPAFIQALLEQTADSLDSLQRIMTRGEESRIAANQSTQLMAERLGTMTDQMRTEQNVLLRVAETQTELKNVLARFAEQARQGDDRAGFGGDDVTRGYLRNLDSSVSRLGAELGQGREEMVQEIRTEIRLLARTIAASSGAVTPGTVTPGTVTLGAPSPGHTGT